MFNPSYAMFIGLNPSTADEVRDDPTIRRCIGFAKQWGYGALCMTNIFAFRATDPKVMKAASDTVGPDNDKWLSRCAKDAEVVIAAWGVHGSYLARDEKVLKLIGNVMCLGLTRGSNPRHPLYLLKTAKPQLFAVSTGEKP
jgi:hypothetical protein